MLQKNLSLHILLRRSLQKEDARWRRFSLLTTTAPRLKREPRGNFTLLHRPRSSGLTEGNRRRDRSEGSVVGEAEQVERLADNLQLTLLLDEERLGYPEVKVVIFRRSDRGET